MWQPFPIQKLGFQIGEECFCAVNSRELGFGLPICGGYWFGLGEGDEGVVVAGSRVEWRDSYGGNGLKWALQCGSDGLVMVKIGGGAYGFDGVRDGGRDSLHELVMNDALRRLCSAGGGLMKMFHGGSSA
ncbi:hypothetical protein LR48_Vigan03g152800 [Vigna angularis]|uniref:Uncharacterized protein n=1 Tax=Phaseolus angularis TaxID=3914 RepID=A0A0L9U5U8_PHAAN|nr:hypothetical protein LR48_Vigan03g152800 [Vigna angularis]